MLKIGERIRTATLTILIVITILLTAQYWTTKGMYATSGKLSAQYQGTILEQIYNSLSKNDLNLPETQTGEIQHLTLPKMLSVRVDGVQSTIKHEVTIADNYDLVVKISEFLNTLIDNTLPEKSNAKLWNDALKNDGLLLDYGLLAPCELIFSVTVKNKNDTSSYNFVTRYVFLYKQNDKIEVLLYDGYSDDIYIVSADENLLSNYQSLTSAVYNKGVGGYELAVNNEYADKFPPHQLIPENEINVKEIERVPFGFDTENSRPTLEFVNGVLSALYYNIYNINRYPQADSVNYVERESVTHFYFDGRVVYKSNSTYSGIAISRLLNYNLPEGFSIADYVNAAQTLLTRFNKEISGGDAAKLELSELKYNDDGSVDIFFDYYAQGVLLNTKAVENVNTKNHSAVIKIKEGFICYLELYTDNFVYTDNLIKPISFATAYFVTSIAHNTQKFNQGILVCNFENQLSAYQWIFTRQSGG